MDDFIFGTLDTDAQRLERHKAIHLGVCHLLNREPLDPLPDQPVTLWTVVGPQYFPVNGWVYYTTDGSDPIGEKGVALNGQVVQLDKVMSKWDDLVWGYVNYFKATLPGQKDGTIVRYRLSILLPNNVEIFADNGTYYAYLVDSFTPPDWPQDAVIYHVFVDRFARPKGESWEKVTTIEDIYGGNLRGILDRLDYLEGLGVNAIYLSPIFPSKSHHRYDAIDYFDIDPMVGTISDFKLLVDALHRRNIRIILDFVPNHWSDLHPTFRDAISKPDSEFRDWYIFFKFPDLYDCFFGVPCMPKVNLRNPQARKYMLDAAEYWLRLGVDGYRIDHAIGPTPDFWAEFRLRARTVNPDCWMIGEIIDSPTVQLRYSGLLDGCLDFLLLEALRQTFATQQWNIPKLASFLAAHFSVFPERFSLPSFLDNHDMDRFIWAAKGDWQKLRLAALCQFTLPGTPIIYYGTEVGLSQNRGIREQKGAFGRLEEARLPMIWDERQNASLLNYYQKLISLRTNEIALRRGKLSIKQATDNILVYSREHPEQQLLVVLNVSTQNQVYSMDSQWGQVIFATNENIHGPHHPSDGTMHFHLPPMSGVVLKQNTGRIIDGQN